MMSRFLLLMIVDGVCDGDDGGGGDGLMSSIRRRLMTNASMRLRMLNVNEIVMLANA